MIIPLDIVQVFQDKWPELTFIVVLIALFVVMAVVITKFYYTKIHSKISSLEGKVQHSDCQRHGVAINGFDASTQAILHKIEFIERALIAKDPNMLTTFAQSNSPLQLNQRAIDLMTASGADEILEKHKDDLVKQIEELESATAYDVEQNAYKVLILNSNASWFIPLKEYIFNNPIFQGHNVNLDVICFVMSLPLRNHYFEKHPEID